MFRHAALQLNIWTRIAILFVLPCLKQRTSELATNVVFTHQHPENIRRFADYFGVSPELFVPASEDVAR